MSEVTKKSQSEDKIRLAQFFAAAASVIAAIVALFSLFWSIMKPQSLGGADREVASKAQIETVKSEIISIKQELARLNDQSNVLSQSTSQSVLASNMAGLKNSLGSVDKRLANIEGIIVQDPQKALEIPLLRKDLDNISSTTQMQISALRQDVERSYNLVLVTIVALAIAVLAPALGNIFKKDKEGKEKE